MRVNSVSNVKSYGTFGVKRNSGVKKSDKVSRTGMNGDKLIWDGDAEKYFTLYKNISDAKVGTKFLIKPKDEEFKDLTLLITPDTIIQNRDLYIGVEESSPLSFKGRLYGSIRQDGDDVDYNMQNQYIRFWQEGMHSRVKNYYSDKEYAPDLKKDYNFFIPSDGDGTRYKDITTLQGGVTKPASYIPAALNSRNMSLVQNVISNFTRTGKLDKMYDFVKVKPAQGSAYAFLEGLKSGQIPTDKPIVFSWGDNFTDVNISKLMYDHEKSKSDFTITTLPVDKSQTKSLSVVKIDSLRNKSILDFVEKPQDDDFIDGCVVEELGEDVCLSAVGPYIISPKVLRWIKNGYTKNPEAFKNPDKGYDFSSMIIAPALKAMKSGVIPNANMKLAIISDDESWSDLGSQKDFTAAMYDIANGYYSYLPREILSTIKDNVDDNGNITFNNRSRFLFDSLINKFGLKAENVIAYCKD